MGTWGTGILHDDFALDIYQDYIERWNAGIATPEAVRIALEQEYADSLDDVDDEPVFWLALARVQWECGVLQTDILAKVKEIIESGRSLQRWEDAIDTTAHGRRRGVLKRFLNTLRTPCSKPRRRKKCGNL